MQPALILLTATLALAGEFTTPLNDNYPYTVSAITTDPAGNTYVVGSRAVGGSPLAFAVIGVFPFSPTVFENLSQLQSGLSDIFISKLDPNGKLLFTDTFAGKGNDMGTAIALDPSGNIYIAGTTTSPDFPLSKALQTQSNTTAGSGFIIKLSNDGTTILYSTYFGGILGATSITSLATDAAGNLYLTGSSTSPDFPHTPGMPFSPLTPSARGAIVASISAAGDKILYSGAIVPAGPVLIHTGIVPVAPIGTTGVSIAVDPTGNAYIAGNTDSAGLPATNGVLSPTGVGAFVAKIKTGGTGLGYLTYIGSTVNTDIMTPINSAANNLSAIAVDAAGNAYLAGSSSDPKFPATAGAYESKYTVPPFGTGPSPTVFEGFVAKLKPDASGMVWATLLGQGVSGGSDTRAQSIAIGPSGNVWATGTNGDSTFPNTNGWTTGPEFLVGLNPAGSALIYSALYPSGTVAQAVALDPSGLVHTAGLNGFISAITPTAVPSMKIFGPQNAAGGNISARLSPGEVIAIYGPGIGPAATFSATGIAATPTGSFYPTTLGGVQVTINGVNIPLLYVSANQINAVVPMKLIPGGPAILRVTNGAATSPDFPVWIVTSAPQAFAPVLNQDGTINSPAHPAKSNTTVTFYATGWQSNFFPLADGQVATVAQDFCQNTCGAFSTSNVNTPNVTVAYGGAAPGIVAGVTQFNVKIGAVSASLGFTLQVTGPATVTQTVWVTP